MAHIHAARAWPFGSQGHGWQDFKTLLYTKYKSSGPCGFREEDFYVFPIVSLWGLMTKHCFIQNIEALSLVVSDKKKF